MYVGQGRTPMTNLNVNTQQSELAMEVELNEPTG